MDRCPAICPALALALLLFLSNHLTAQRQDQTAHQLTLSLNIPGKSLLQKLPAKLQPYLKIAIITDNQPDQPLYAKIGPINTTITVRSPRCLIVSLQASEFIGFFINMPDKIKPVTLGQTRSMVIDVVPNWEAIGVMSLALLFMLLFLAYFIKSFRLQRRQQQLILAPRQHSQPIRHQFKPHRPDSSPQDIANQLIQTIADIDSSNKLAQVVLTALADNDYLTDQLIMLSSFGRKFYHRQADILEKHQPTLAALMRHIAPAADSPREG